MDNKDIKQTLENFDNIIEFLTFQEKVEIVAKIQNSVPNWGQAVIDELNRSKGEL